MAELFCWERKEYPTQQQVDDWLASVEWLELQGNAEDEAVAGWMRTIMTTGHVQNDSIRRRVAAAMKRWRERRATA